MHNQSARPRTVPGYKLRTHATVRDGNEEDDCVALATATATCIMRGELLAGGTVATTDHRVLPRCLQTNTQNTSRTHTSVHEGKSKWDLELRSTRALCQRIMQSGLSSTTRWHTEKLQGSGGPGDRRTGRGKHTACGSRTARRAMGQTRLLVIDSQTLHSRPPA